MWAAPSLSAWGLSKVPVFLASHRSLPSVWVALAAAGSTNSGSTGQHDGAVEATGGVHLRHGRLPSAAVQAHFNSYGIDVSKVMQRYRFVAGYEVERVERMTSYLAQLGVDVKRVVEKQPSILSGQVQTYEAVEQLLRDNGIDVVKAVNRNPSVLGRRRAKLQCAFDAIVHCGHSVAKVANRHPSILQSSSSNISALLRLGDLGLKRQRAGGRILTRKQLQALWRQDPKAALLFSVGLDASHLLKRQPQAVHCSYEKLYRVLRYLHKLGVDVPKVVWYVPQVLGLRPEALQGRVQFLAENG
eukprot:EG_transcript_21020